VYHVASPPPRLAEPQEAVERKPPPLFFSPPPPPPGTLNQKPRGMEGKSPGNKLYSSCSRGCSSRVGKNPKSAPTSCCVVGGARPFLAVSPFLNQARLIQSAPTSCCVVGGARPFLAVSTDGKNKCHNRLGKTKHTTQLNATRFQRKSISGSGDFWPGVSFME